MGTFPRKPLWKWGSPSLVMGAVLSFFLPWFDIKCHKDTQTGAVRRNDGTYGPKYETVTRTVITQSGFEALFGKYTPHFPSMGEGPAKMSSEPKPAPILGCYFVSLVIAMIAGLLLERGRIRAVSVLLFVGLALSALLIQFYRGFPIKESVAAENAVAIRSEAELMQDPMHKKNTSPVMRGTTLYTLHYSWGYYGTLGCLSAALLASVVELFVYKRGKGPAPLVEDRDVP